MFTKEEAYSKIDDLVERFSLQIDSYKKSDFTDDKINKLVYQLYGLSEEEIAIVEGK